MRVFYNLQDAIVIVRANAADILFVLLVKVGGSAPARKIASVAEATGLSLHRRQYEIRHRQRGYDPLGLVDPAIDAETFPCDIFSPVLLRPEYFGRTSTYLGRKSQCPGGSRAGVELDDNKVDFFWVR